MASEKTTSGNATTAWVAVLTAAISVGRTYIATRGGVHQKELEVEQVQMKLDQERASAAGVRRDKYVEEFTVHEARVRTLTQDVPHWVLAFKNRCTETVRVAIGYTALDGEGVFQGWWSIDPNAQINVASPDHTRRELN